MAETKDRACKAGAGEGDGAQADCSATGRPKRFFFGWWVVIGGLFIMATCYTAFVNCIPLFQTHIVRNLGITVGQFNTGVSLCTVVAGTRLLVSVVISNWFTLKRGLAVSIALAGSGLGGVVLSSATSAMIASWGWRPAFLLLAAICLVVALPISLVVFVTRPSDKGMAPYGAGQVEEAKADRSPDKPVTVSVGWLVLRRNAGFWLLVFGFVMMGITNGAFITNAVANMTSITVDGVEIVTGGHSTMWAGAVWSFYLGLVIFAKISLGAIYDRFGLKVGTGLGTAASVAAAIALCFAATDWGPIVACIFFVFATCMGTVAPPVVVAKQYGKKDFGTVTGIVTAFELFGAAVGSVASGLISDAYLSFTPVWVMMGVASVLMDAALLASIPLAAKLVERRRAEGVPELDAEGFEIERA